MSLEMTEKEIILPEVSKIGERVTETFIIELSKSLIHRTTKLNILASINNNIYRMLCDEHR